MRGISDRLSARAGSRSLRAGGVLALAGVALAAGEWGLGAGAGPADAATVVHETPVTAMDHSLAPSNNSPVIVADPTEARFVVMANRLDAPDFGCALQVSGDAGRRWVSVNPVASLPAGADKCYAPEVAFGPDGTLYYLFVGLHGAGNEPMGAFLVTSADRAQRFSPPRRVLGRLNFAVRMAIDRSKGPRGRLHLVWLHATADPPLGGLGPPPNPILAAYSDDGGRSFSQAVQVSDRARARVVAPGLVLARDGRVHVAYYDLEADAIDYQGLAGPRWDGTWSVVVANSTDGGVSFARGVVAEDSVVPPERVMLVFTMAPPSLAVVDHEVCVAWTDARHGDPDAFLRCSAEQGRTWGPRRRLNDDPVGNGRSQYLPKLASSPGGRLDAVFLDRRRDPENASNDVYYTHSGDGGRRFARNVRVSAEPSFSRIGQEYVGPAAEGQVEFGSRLGLLSRPETVVVAWPDTRNSRPGTTAQDIFAANLALAGDDEGSPVPFVVALLAVLCLAGGGVVVVRRLRSAPGER